MTIKDVHVFVILRFALVDCKRMCFCIHDVMYVLNPVSQSSQRFFFLHWLRSSRHNSKEENAVVYAKLSYFNNYMMFFIITLVFQQKLAEIKQSKHTGIEIYTCGYEEKT